MQTTLRVLVVEDSDDDAAMLLAAIRKGYQLTSERVYTASTMRAALAQPSDLVISDWSMPQFDGLAAFKITRELGLDIPFFIVSARPMRR